MIPWAEPEFFGNEHQYVLDVLKSRWISEGEYVTKLENCFKSAYGTPYFTAVANGTAALHLAFLACGIKPNDEVIVPSYGFLATVNVLKLMNVKIVFCDVNIDTWCLDTSQLIDLIGEKTRAIVTIHNYGNVFSISDLQQISKKYGLYLIEDCAEAFPCYFGKKLAGSFGDIATFSFQSSKNIVSGEGGMINCRSKVLHERVRLLKNHGMDRKIQYWHSMPGLNYRLTNIQAAIATAQFEHLIEIKRKKDQIFNYYQSALCVFPELVFQKIEKKCTPTMWATAVRIKTIKSKKESSNLVAQMKNLGVECRLGFWEAHQMGYVDDPGCVVAATISKQIVVLPISTKLTNKNLEFVVECLRTTLRDMRLISGD